MAQLSHCPGEPLASAHGECSSSTLAELGVHSAQHLWVETRKPDGQFEQRNVDDCSLRVFVFDGRGNELKPQVSQSTV